MSKVTPLLDHFDMLMARAKELDTNIRQIKRNLTTLEKLSELVKNEAEQILKSLEPLEKEADKKYGKKP